MWYKITQSSYLYLNFWKMATSEISNANQKVISIQFEVFGKVQGVYFRKHTQEKGESLGLRGYCENTAAGTVVGILEGEKQKVGEMKEWLREVGSPKSRIDKIEFSNEEPISKFTYEGFTIRL